MRALVLFLLAFIAPSSNSLLNETETTCPVGEIHYDYLMLTLIYPKAMCRADDDTIPDSCEVPDGTPTWTIHGLWPNYNGGGYPEDCPGKKFDVSQVESIRDILRKDWPNMYPKKSESSLWAHEWDKHGTCAEALESLGGELKYFSKTLDIYKSFDVVRALSNEQIIPSDSPYQLSAIEKAFEWLTNGKKIQVNCLTDKKTHQTLLGDLRICLDCDFKPIDCPENEKKTLDKGGSPLPAYHPCPKHSIIYLREDTWLMGVAAIGAGVSLLALLSCCLCQRCCCRRELYMEDYDILP